MRTVAALDPAATISFEEVAAWWKATRMFLRQASIGTFNKYTLKQNLKSHLSAVQLK